jgi:hypothetical protein
MRAAIEARAIDQRREQPLEHFRQNPIRARRHPWTSKRQGDTVTRRPDLFEATTDQFPLLASGFRF